MEAAGFAGLRGGMPSETHADFSASEFIWAAAPASEINQFVSFEQTIERPPEAPVLHLFADSRFRLWVNEQFVAYGPGRFVTQFPEFDSYDLSPWLRDGPNRIRVEVNYYGCSSFQTMPDGKPGFIAAGQGTGYDFRTPGAWKVRVHRAWEELAPHFSFAQNPVEICDTRVLAAELADPALPAAPVFAPAQPWGSLTPRSAPYPKYDRMRPARVVAAGPLSDRWNWIGFQSIDADFVNRRDSKQRFRRFVTWIHSPGDQTVDLQCFWSELELNGAPLEVNYDTPLGNHGVVQAPLRAGWNLLSAAFKVLTKQWSYMVAVDRDTGTSFHAVPDQGVAEPLLVSPLEAEERRPLPAIEPEAFTAPDGWERNDGRLEPVTPARVMAWDQFVDEQVTRDIPFERLGEVKALRGALVSWTLDAGDEYYGQFVLEVEGPEGAVLDIAYDDWLSPRGMTNLYVSNPFTDTADRFILRGGRQRIEVTNPRGGIFVQVTLRNPDSKQAAEFILHDVVIRSRRTLNAEAAHFESGDATMDWAFEKSLHTLVASTDESYSDCPWRERGSYIGDGLVNVHLHHLLSSDMSIARRCIRIFGQAQNEDGRLPPVAPAWHRRSHEDFTMIWMIMLRDYWAKTGDTETVRECWPAVKRIWDSPAWELGPNGLWNVTGAMHPFVDWGVLQADREGEANAVLNLFRFAALQACAELAEALGEPSGYEAKAGAVKSAIEQTLWDAKERRFLPRLDENTPAVHANILALRFGVGDAPAIIDYLTPLLEKNFRQGIDHGQRTGFAELYFFYYLLPALAEHGRAEFAEKLIRQHYGFLHGLNYPTLNECFSRAHRGVGSCCHSWAGAPALYLVEQVVGLKQKTPGDPSVWLLEPQPSALTKVSYRLPVTGGAIAIRMMREGGVIRAEASAPDSVTIEPIGVEMTRVDAS